MGIPHLEDLTPAQLEMVINSPRWLSTKLDGSFIAFGIDIQGRFYTERKNGQRFYDISEWPVEGWSAGFRQAHMVLENFMEVQQAIGEVGRGSYATAEILWGSQPNVVEYTSANNIVIHPGSNFDSRTNRSIKVATEVLKSDGRTAWKELSYREWSVQVQHERKSSVDFKEIHYILEWLDLPSRVKPYSMRQILDFKLNRRPEGYTQEAWKASVPLIKEERERLREAYRFKLDQLRKELLTEIRTSSYNTIHTHNLAEGYVFRLENDFRFKLIYREWFGPANHFIHWVRYCLIGGRRPARPSFESRTRYWPLEKRLHRLDVLLDRYLAHHEKMTFRLEGYTSPASVSYSDEIHDRVLVLFYDFRERLKSGRTGVQRKHPTDSTSGDSSNPEVAWEPFEILPATVETPSQ